MINALFLLSALSWVCNHTLNTPVISTVKSFFHVSAAPLRRLSLERSGVRDETKTYSQLILDLSLVTKKVAQRASAHFATVKDLCDEVWQNILKQAIGYDRVDVVPDDCSNEHTIKAIT